MKSIFTLMAVVSFLSLPGCNNEAQIAGEFQLPSGTIINFHTDIQVTYSDSGLYFTLKDVPTTKNNRDFTDFISVELLDEKGKSYGPDKIWDINGSKRDIVASYKNLPKGVRINTVRMIARKDLEGSNIRWWSGELK